LRARYRNRQSSQDFRGRQRPAGLTGFAQETARASFTIPEIPETRPETLPEVRSQHVALESVHRLEDRLSGRVRRDRALEAERGLPDRVAPPVRARPEAREHSVPVEQQGGGKTRRDDLPGEGPPPRRHRLAAQPRVLRSERCRERGQSEPERAIRPEPV